MTASTFRSVLPWLVSVLAVGLHNVAVVRVSQDPAALAEQDSEEEEAMKIHYLEVVTPDVDAKCAALAELHGVTFGKPAAELGNARTAALEGGGSIGVRAPMHEAESPVVRPYLLVDDVAAATEAAEAAGGEIMLPPTEIHGRGRFSIYAHGGIQHGLWQL